MIFFRFVLIYLLVFTSYIAYRFSKLEPEHIHEITLVIGAITGLFTTIFSLIPASNSDIDSNSEADSIDSE